MKHSLIIVICTSILCACNSSSSTKTTDVDTSSKTMVTTVDTSTIKHIDTTSTTVISEGDMTVKDGKVMVMKNGKWEEVKGKTKLANGAVVMDNGIIVKDGKKMKLQKGYTVKISGNMMDESGKMVDSAMMEKNWIDKGDRKVNKQGEMEMKTN